MSDDFGGGDLPPFDFDDFDWNAYDDQTEDSPDFDDLPPLDFDWAGTFYNWDSELDELPPLDIDWSDVPEPTLETTTEFLDDEFFDTIDRYGLDEPLVDAVRSGDIDDIIPEGHESRGYFGSYDDAAEYADFLDYLDPYIIYDEETGLYEVFVNPDTGSTDAA